MFICDCCGLCCRHLNSYPLYATMDRGDGVCIHFNEESKLCNIYDKRPDICNVDKMYEICYKGKLSKEEYYQKNYEACGRLKKEAKISVYKNAL